MGYFYIDEGWFEFFKMLFLFLFFKIDQSPALHLRITCQMTSVASDLSLSGTTLAK
jgi:hypothetical protein